MLSYIFFSKKAKTGTLKKV